jgi:hypothetical protein
MSPIVSKNYFTRHRSGPTTAFLLATLLSPGLIFAAQQDGADVQPRHRLTLIWNDPHQLLQTGFDEITKELDSIFREFDVGIEWKKQPSMVMEVSGGAILVLLLPEKPANLMPGIAVMGVTSHSRTPVIRIFFDSVAKTLGVAPLPLRPADRKRRVLLTRATGRILAHEIIHVIAPAHPHASSGLMKSHLTRSSFMDDEVNLEPCCTDAIVAALNKSYEGEPAPAP